MRIKLAILTGGSSIEKEISYKSCQNVICFLDYNKYKVKVIEIYDHLSDLKWIKELIDFKPQIVFSTLHGGQGENGDIQGMLNILGLPYVGSKVLASSICIDKNLTKRIVKQNFVPVAESIFIPKDDNLLKYKEKLNEIGYPFIIKPNKGGGSIGISVANDFEQIIEAVDIVNKLQDDSLIEKFIKGTEVTCGVIESAESIDVLPILDIELKNQNEFFDYKNKYTTGQNSTFSNLPIFLQTMIQEVAKKVFLILGCTGYANIDFIINEEQIYFIEINTLPGLTKTSLLPKATKDFSKFIDNAISLELNRK